MRDALFYAIGCLVGLLVGAPGLALLIGARYARELRKLQFAECRREAEFDRFMNDVEQALAAQTFLAE